MIPLYRLLFVCLALLGAFILFKIIPVITKMVTEKPIMTLPLTQDSGSFAVPVAGDYAIWQKGSGFSRTRIETGLPVIIQVSSGLKLTMNRTGGMITANDASGTRRQLYTFSVPEKGQYRIGLPAYAGIAGGDAGSSAAGIKNASRFSLEIRKPMPVFRLVGCILGILAGFAMLAGGITGVALAERII